MTRSQFTALLLAGIAPFAMPAAAQARAADAPATPVAADSTAPAAADAGEDGDIVVTAQHRSENALAVPIAVSVLRPEDLHDFEAAGGDTLLSLSGRVPSLYVESTTGRIFPRFYIRGLGNIDFYLGASQPVSIIQDDVVEEHVVLKSNPAFDIAQVEVLKGPQGSLFGRNTTAGIIKFDSAQPSQTWQGQGSVSYGGFNSVNADAGVGGPLNSSGTLSFRLSGLYQHRDDWVSNVYKGPSDDGTVPGKNVMGGFDERDIRLQLLAQPTEALTLRLSGHYRDYDGTATVFYRGSITPGTNRVPSDLDRTIVSYDEAQNNTQAYKTGGVSLKADYDLGIATLTSITAWEHASGFSRGDTDGGAAADFGGVAPNYCAVGCGESQGRLRGLNQWSEEVRIASPNTGRFKWQFGGMYFDARDMTEFDQRGFFLTSNALGTTPNANNWVLLHDVNTSWAVFGQASYDLTDRLTVTGGVRVTNDSKETTLLKTAGAFPGATRVKMSDTQPSWDASLLYHASQDVSLYARVARGFRGPTIQGRSAVFNSPFTTADSETNTSFEGGLKTAWLDNAVRFNLTGFYYYVDNIQLNGNDSNGNGVLFNAKKAVGYGMEGELEVRPVKNFHINAGLSLLKTRIEDHDAVTQVGSVGAVLSQTVLNPVVKRGSIYVAQIDGNSLPNAPDYNLNVSARYDLPLDSSDHRLFVAADFNLQGKINYVPYKTVEYTSDGNNELGLKVGFAFQRYEIAGFVRNLTNAKNLIGVIDTADYRAGVYNDPRVFGVTLSGSFR